MSMHKSAVALRVFCLSAPVLALLSTPSFAQWVYVTSSNAASASGAAGGLHGGYDWRSGPVVYGLGADFSATGVNSSMTGGLKCPIEACSSFSPPPAANASTSLEWYGTVQGRLGIATGPLLFYGTGGLAYGKVDLTSNFSVNGLSSTTETAPVKIGGVIGGGIAYMLPQNATLSLGYQYVDLGTIGTGSFPSGVCCAGYLTQSASAHAQFQMVTLGLSFKFAPAGAAPWQGGSFGAQVGGGWGDKASAANSATFFSCFTASTQVTMADGTRRPIAAVKIGDQVLGENGAVNRVVAIETPVLGTRKLYSFNDGPAFVTPEHPFMTPSGWKSVAPEATVAENSRLVVGKLEIGDKLVKLDTVMPRPKPMTVALGSAQPPAAVDIVVETKLVALTAMTPHDGDSSMRLYNLRLDGDHSYFADDYLVHNKG